jgi:signal recognition particle subunit SRP54
MFEELIQKLNVAVKKIRGVGKITEKNIAESMREIRRVLLEADVNYKVVKEFISNIQNRAVGQEVVRSITPGQQVVKIVHDELVQLLGQANVPIRFSDIPPSIIMIVGLQGSGKTTFSGKLGVYLRKQNRNPLLVAADIYRPAAIEQLKVLGKAVNLPVFSLESEPPITVINKAVIYARQKGLDTLILDTAGRLHVDDQMMSELENINKKFDPTEILFVADGMTGQDAVNSAQMFLDKINFDGIVLTKLDGDSKGGAAISIRAVTGKPIKFISTGEKLDAIESFHPDRIASRILGMGDIVTLVEKAQESVDLKQAEELTKKLRKQIFTFEDFYNQLQQIKRLGPLNQIAAMLPGSGGNIGNLQMDDYALVKTEAIINSMTISERQNPHILNGSRRKRIAAGSGTSVQDVNRLLKQFQMMRKMMKQIGQRNIRSFNQRIPLGI